jgi:adenylate cyclase
MLMRLDRFNRQASERGWPTLRIGVGINTGEMVFGNMGSKHHMALTVMGDEVNLASRLEGLAPIYGAAIIVSDATLREAGDEFAARELDRVRVKGREQPTRIFEVFLPDAIDADYLEAYATGLAAYKQAQWRIAGDLFSRALDKRPGDAAASLFVERCRDLEASGSQEIDRVTEFTVK